MQQMWYNALKIKPKTKLKMYDTEMKNVL